MLVKIFRCLGGELGWGVLGICWEFRGGNEGCREIRCGNETLVLFFKRLLPLFEGYCKCLWSANFPTLSFHDHFGMYCSGRCTRVRKFAILSYYFVLFVEGLIF